MLKFGETSEFTLPVDDYFDFKNSPAHPLNPNRFISPKFDSWRRKGRMQFDDHFFSILAEGSSSLWIYIKHPFVVCSFVSRPSNWPCNISDNKLTLFPLLFFLLPLLKFLWIPTLDLLIQFLIFIKICCFEFHPT